VRRAALAATLVFLLASAPAYGQDLRFATSVFGPTVPCNPSVAVLTLTGGGRSPIPPLWAKGVAWVDYFGIPVAVSAPFSLPPPDPDGVVRQTWEVPSASSVLPGRYTLHVLLQGSPAFWGPLAYLAYTTESATATIDPRLNTDCSPISAPASAPALGATGRTSGQWFGSPLGSRPH
jgi:hypothetical protein